MSEPRMKYAAPIAVAVFILVMLVAFLATFDPYRDLHPARVKYLKMERSAYFAAVERERKEAEYRKTHPKVYPDPDQQWGPYWRNTTENWREDPPKNYKW